MSYLVICPFVHRPSFDRMIATLHPSLSSNALIIDNTPPNRNLGAAGSRNVGARRILDEGIDWLVDISPVTRFGIPGGMDFIGEVEAAEDAWVVQSASPVNWHAMAWSRRMFERVGLFDENHWPIYGEDGDISYRIHQAVREDNLSGIWPCVEIDAWITMFGHSFRLAKIATDQARSREYHILKWGGDYGAETFTRPFNDPSHPLAFWPTPPDPRAINHEGWQ